jgi:hypothetical protein
VIRLRSSRTAGRHRPGQPYTIVHRRVWDGPARAEAERLERSRPAWRVLYSLGDRRFYAIARGTVSEAVIVEDDTAEGLEKRMREMETLLTWQAPSPSPSSGGGSGAVRPAYAVTAPAHGVSSRHTAVPRRPFRRAV